MNWFILIYWFPFPLSSFNLFKIFFWLRFIRKFQNAESRSQRKGEEGREEGGPASHGRRQEGGEEAGQSSFREEAQEFRHRSGHPAQARSDPIRPLAQVRRPPETKGRPSTTSQSSASD